MGGTALEATNDNTVILEGFFLEHPSFSHEVFGESFYTARFSVDRLSSQKDILNITISSRILGSGELDIAAYARITGQLRSYNKMENGKNKLMLTVFARSLEFPEERALEPNLIELTGFICKEPIYRTTPFGREITDLLLAVNRHFNKTDYIPVLTWGKNAKFAQTMEIGDKVRVEGRLQSRTYTKVLADGTTDERVAFEVSSSLVVLLDSPEEESEPEDYPSCSSAHLA